MKKTKKNSINISIFGFKDNGKEKTIMPKKVNTLNLHIMREVHYQIVHPPPLTPTHENNLPNPHKIMSHPPRPIQNNPHSFKIMPH